MFWSILISIVATVLLVFGVRRVAISPFQRFNQKNFDRANWGLAAAVVGLLILAAVWAPYIHTG